MTNKLSSNDQVIQQELAKHGITPTIEPAPTDAAHVVIEKEIEAKIKEAEKPSKVTLSLTYAERQALEREARALGIDYKQHLLSLVQELLNDRVGKTLITGPSFAAKKIRGASNYSGSKYF